MKEDSLIDLIKATLFLIFVFLPLMLFILLVCLIDWAYHNIKGDYMKCDCGGQLIEVGYKEDFKFECKKCHQRYYGGL